MTDIYKIDKSTPNHKDKYFVDTNVWFWFTYCASKEMAGVGAKRYQVDKYPEFIEKVLDAGAKLYHCPLVYSELANVIEKAEYQIYLNENGDVDISRKKFRKISEQREKFLKELDHAWKTVQGISNCIDVKLNSALVGRADAILRESLLDPYDAFYFNIMNIAGIDRLITDDRDFMSVDIANLYTANDSI